ncbi:hypothetical protein [Desulfovibrio inopinatus]|uniref:hypothetical protein n=1 Tax=Desulfovibrio inopinatus TaxID=102109 RepID=UPI0012EB40D0|nr:hypothetical protein [Desulfovibrio inopinatus]
MTSQCFATRCMYVFVLFVAFCIASGPTASSAWAQPEARYWRIERFVMPGPSGMNATRAQTFVGKVVEFNPNPTSATTMSFEGETCAVSVLPRRINAGGYISSAYHVSPKALDIDPATRITVVETGCRLPGLERVIQVSPRRLIFMRDGVFFLLSPAPRPSAPPPVPGMNFKQYPGIGLTVSYPRSVQFVADGRGPRHGLGIAISITPLSQLEPGDGPFDASRKIALEDRQALRQGQFGAEPPFAVPASQRVRPIPGRLHAKVFTTLAEFEICSVVFEQTAIFYRGDTQIRIRLMAAPDAVMNQNPTFFTRDPAQCGQQLIWNFPRNADIIPVFYERMLNHQTGPASAAWLSTFQTILDNLRMTP